MSIGIAAIFLSRNLHILYTKQKRFDEAIEIGENNPDNEIIQYKLMISYIKIGKFEKAKLSMFDLIAATVFFSKKGTGFIIFAF